MQSLASFIFQFTLFVISIEARNFKSSVYQKISHRFRLLEKTIKSVYYFMSVMKDAKRFLSFVSIEPFSIHRDYGSAAKD